MISGVTENEFSVLPAEFCRETLIKLRENIDDGIYLKPVEKLLGWAGFMF